MTVVDEIKLTECKICTALNLHTSLFVQQSVTRVLGRLRVVAKKIFPLGEGIVAVHCLFLLSSSLWWLYKAGTRWVISASKLGRSKHLVLVGAGWEAGLFRDCFVEILCNYKVQKQNVKMGLYDKTTYHLIRIMIELYHIILTAEATRPLALRKHGLKRLSKAISKLCVLVTVRVSKFVLALY